MPSAGTCFRTPFCRNQSRPVADRFNRRDVSVVCRELLHDSAAVAVQALERMLLAVITAVASLCGKPQIPRAVGGKRTDKALTVLRNAKIGNDGFFGISVRGEDLIAAAAFHKKKNRILRGTAVQYGHFRRIVRRGQRFDAIYVLRL